MTKARSSKLLILLILLFSLAAISEQPIKKPKNSAIQTDKSVPADVPLSQPIHTEATTDVMDLAHTVIVTAETHITTMFHMCETLAIILGLAGAANFFVSFHDRKKMERLDADLQKLAKNKSDIKNDIEALMKEKDNISKDMEDFKKQEKVLRRLMETVQVATLATSRLSVNTRLRALQQLSQQLDPLGIPCLLEVLKSKTDDISLRREANYGLGRYSEDPASFRGFYSEIFSGFREVLKDAKTPRGLALDIIASARQFGFSSAELNPLFEKWEKAGAQGDLQPQVRPLVGVNSA